MSDVPVWVWALIAAGVAAAVVVIAWARLRRPPPPPVIASPEMVTLVPIDPARPGTELLRPRLVSEARRAALGNVPSRRVEALGLHLVYVLDAADSVTFVSHEAAEGLGLTEAGLHARSLANLQPSLSAETVRRAVEGHELQVIQRLDGHDAARLLLIPPLLRAGERVAAVIPDVDMLAIVQAHDDDFTALRRLPRSAHGERLLDGVILVTPEGFRRMG